MNEPNLNMLMLCSQKAISENDVELAKNLWKLLEGRLLEENFSVMSEEARVDKERERVFSHLITTIGGHVDFEAFILGVAATFEGWNIDYQEVYREVKREAFVCCCLIRLFEHHYKAGIERREAWKRLLSLYVNEYNRCDNGYIASDDLAKPFVVAVEVADEYLDDECRWYLHALLIENVLSIVTLMNIFSRSNGNLSGETAKMLLGRVDEEWESARMLMEVRGQGWLMRRIDELVDSLRRMR